MYFGEDNNFSGKNCYPYYQGGRNSERLACPFQTTQRPSEMTVILIASIKFPNSLHVEDE